MATKNDQKQGLLKIKSGTFPSLAHTNPTALFKTKQRLNVMSFEPYFKFHHQVTIDYQFWQKIDRLANKVRTHIKVKNIWFSKFVLSFCFIKKFVYTPGRLKDILIFDFILTLSWRRPFMTKIYKWN